MTRVEVCQLVKMRQGSVSKRKQKAQKHAGRRKQGKLGKDSKTESRLWEVGTSKVTWI